MACDGDACVRAEGAEAGHGRDVSVGSGQHGGAAGNTLFSLVNTLNTLISLVNTLNTLFSLVRETVERCEQPRKER